MMKKLPAALALAAAISLTALAAPAQAAPSAKLVTKTYTVNYSADSILESYYPASFTSNPCTLNSNVKCKVSATPTAQGYNMKVTGHLNTPAKVRKAASLGTVKVKITQNLTKLTTKGKWGYAVYDASNFEPVAKQYALKKGSNSGSYVSIGKAKAISVEDYFFSKGNVTVKSFKVTYKYYAKK